MPDPISTPLPLKLRRLKLQLGPALVFVLALGGAVWLWSRQSVGGTVAGEVSSVTLHVTAPRDGRLVETGSYPKLFDSVTPGQVLAVLSSDSRSSAEQPINLVAPAGGSITAIRRRPGEFVKQGQELFTVTRADSPHIISYVRSGSAVVPKKDGKVLIRSKRKTATATVQQVGASVELIPEHQLTRPGVPEWGIPVRISIPDAAELPLIPGEIVHLTYLP